MFVKCHDDELHNRTVHNIPLESVNWEGIWHILKDEKSIKTVVG